MIRLLALDLDAALLAAIVAALATIGAGVLAIVLGPMVTERVALRHQFFAPFKDWCARLYGSLSELLSWTMNLPSAGLPWPLPYHIASNFAEVHDRLAEADKNGWFTALVNSGYTEDDLRRVREAVDNVYHGLRLPSSTLWSELPKRSRLSETTVTQVIDDLVPKLGQPLRRDLERLSQRVKQEIPRRWGPFG